MAPCKSTGPACTCQARGDSSQGCDRSFFFSSSSFPLLFPVACSATRREENADACRRGQRRLRRLRQSLLVRLVFPTRGAAVRVVESTDTLEFRGRGGRALGFPVPVERGTVLPFSVCITWNFHLLLTDVGDLPLVTLGKLPFVV